MRILILVIILSAFTLSACGNRGSLERPPPLWGEDRPAEPRPQVPDDPFVDEDEREDGLPTIPGQEPFEDDDWD